MDQEDSDQWSEFNQTAHLVFDISSGFTEIINFDNDMATKSEFQIEKLSSGDNFYDWQFQMENYLALKGYSNCIVKKSEEEDVPKETDVTKLSAARYVGVKYGNKFTSTHS